MNFNHSLRASPSNPLVPMEDEKTKTAQKRKIPLDPHEAKMPAKEADARVAKRAKALTINETVEFLTTPFSLNKMTISLADDDDRVDALTLLGLD